jgi:hypothetical protein
VVIDNLFAYSIHKSFAGNFIVGFKNVMQVLTAVLFVTDIDLESVGSSDQPLLVFIVRAQGFQLAQPLVNSQQCAALVPMATNHQPPH